MKRLIGTFGTLFALVLLGVVATCVLGSLIYEQLQEVSGCLRFRPTLTRRKHPYRRQLYFLQRSKPAVAANSTSAQNLLHHATFHQHARAKSETQSS